MATRPLRATVVLVLVGAALTAGQERPAATYVLGGERRAVDAQELESWIEHGNPASDDDEANRRDALRQLILTKSLGQEAERLRLQDEPDVVVDLVMQRGRLALSALRRSVRAAITVSDAEAELKYQQIKDTYTLPRRVRLRNLFKRFPLDATDQEKADLRRELNQLRQRVLEGEDFASLARRESDSQTRFLGGLVGNVRPGTLSEDIDQVAMAMKPGELSQVIEGPLGLTLLYCEKVLEAVERSESELRDVARRLLAQKEWKARWVATEHSLLEQAGAVWDWSSLSVAGEAPLVRYRGGQLGSREVLTIVAPRAARAATDRESAARLLVEMERQNVEARMAPFFRSAAAVKMASSRGLWTSELEQQATWSRWRALAAVGIAKKVQRRLEPASDAELRQLYDANPAEFQQPERYHLRILSLRFDPADPRPGLEQALRLTDALDAGQLTFSEIAREHSTDVSAEDGGDLGWVPRPSLVNRLGIDGVRALRELEPGERSDWVQDNERSRFLLIELREVESARPLTFEEARSRVSQLLGQRRAQELRSELTSEWWRALDVVIHGESVGPH